MVPIYSSTKRSVVRIPLKNSKEARAGCELNAEVWESCFWMEKEKPNKSEEIKLVHPDILDLRTNKRTH